VTLCVCVCVCGNALLQSQACCMPCSFTFLSGADFLHSCTFLDPESRHRVKDTFQNQAKNICARIVLPSMFIFGGSLQVMFTFQGCAVSILAWTVASYGLWQRPLARVFGHHIRPCHSQGSLISVTAVGHGLLAIPPSAMALGHDPWPWPWSTTRAIPSHGPWPWPAA